MKARGVVHPAAIRLLELTGQTLHLSVRPPSNAPHVRRVSCAILASARRALREAQCKPGPVPSCPQNSLQRFANGGGRIRGRSRGADGYRSGQPAPSGMGRHQQTLLNQLPPPRARTSLLARFRQPPCTPASKRAIDTHAGKPGALENSYSRSAWTFLIGLLRSPETSRWRWPADCGPKNGWDRRGKRPSKGALLMGLFYAGYGIAQYLPDARFATRVRSRAAGPRRGSSSCGRYSRRWGAFREPGDDDLHGPAACLLGLAGRAPHPPMMNQLTNSWFAPDERRPAPTASGCRGPVPGPIPDGNRSCWCRSWRSSGWAHRVSSSLAVGRRLRSALPLVSAICARSSQRYTRESASDLACGNSRTGAQQHRDVRISPHLAPAA